MFTAIFVFLFNFGAVGAPIVGCPDHTLEAAHELGILKGAGKIPKSAVRAARNLLAEIEPSDDIHNRLTTALTSKKTSMAYLRGRTLRKYLDLVELNMLADYYDPDPRYLMPETRRLTRTAMFAVSSVVLGAATLALPYPQPVTIPVAVLASYMTRRYFAELFTGSGRKARGKVLSRDSRSGEYSLEGTPSDQWKLLGYMRFIENTETVEWLFIREPFARHPSLLIIRHH